jgi:hypothetical protein
VEEYASLSLHKLVEKISMPSLRRGNIYGMYNIKSQIFMTGRIFVTCDVTDNHLRVFFSLIKLIDSPCYKLKRTYFIVLFSYTYILATYTVCHLERNPETIMYHGTKIKSESVPDRRNRLCQSPS